MRKGIVTFFGYEYDKNQVFEDIKNAGFDSFMTSSDSRFFYQSGDLNFQTKKAQSLGLHKDSLHSTYKTSNLPYFWQKGFRGYKILQGLKKDVKTASKFGFKFLVVHLEGEYSLIGEKRIAKLLEFAKKHNVVIAIENLTKNRDILDRLFKTFDTPNLMFCFDAGHENCFPLQMGVLEQFASRLVCLHLHSNDGTSDMHTLNKYGNVNWERIAKVLAGLKNCDEIVLDYELIMRYRQDDDTAESVLKECYKQACDLEQMIIQFKSKIKK